ncbi:WD repeat-containing protein 70-like [Sycon ciliatum]|uniref:WD repeat-containing protein 70-like n=1 Tax=Sycon ciliatum TaxID=27933 RepID=UPI0020A85048|eukprot:scpid39226/ scgid31843/ WD repeat-containing protein 70
MSGEEQDISSVMGFGSFGSKSSTKKARTFDLESMLAETRKTARQRCGDSSKLQPSSVPDTHSEKRHHTEIEEDDESKEIDDDENDNNEEQDEDEEDDSSDDDADEMPEKNRDVLPISKQVELKHGTKIISAVSLDPAGARLVTGSYDYDIQLWDFSAMDSSLRSFRTKTPWEGYQVNSVAYSTTGDKFSVATTSAQVKVYDRNGGEVLETIKGDSYLHDMTRTKGHISCVNVTCWHPREKEVFLTGADDGTIRFWNVTGNGKKHTEIVKVRQRQARRLPVTAILCSSNGKQMVAGCQDGSLQLYPMGGPYVRPSLIRENAHSSGFVSSLLMKCDGHSLLSRGGDDSVRLWDIRALRQQPVAERTGLTTLQPMMNMAFSPSEKALAVPLAAPDRKSLGCVSFLDSTTLEEKSRIDMPGSSNPVCCLWHPKLNQVVVGCDKGNVAVLYDSKVSLRGITDSLAKRKKKEISGTTSLSPGALPIITPHSLKLFREERYQHGRKREDKHRQDPIKSHRPELPMDGGHGKGGRISGGSSLARHVGQNIAKRVLDNSDPRQSILRHAEAAKNDPYWVSPAYSKTQPEPIFQKPDDEEEEEK